MNQLVSKATWIAGSATRSTGLSLCMKDKLFSFLTTVTTALFSVGLLLLVAWGAWEAGRYTTNSIMSSFESAPTAESRQFFKELSPQLSAISKCSDTISGARSTTTCRAVGSDNTGKVVINQIIRCTAGGATTMTAGAVAPGDPECHVLVDFLAKPDDKKDAKPDGAKADASSTTAPTDAGVPPADAKTGAKVDTKKPAKK